jgi:uncharacterized Zn-finger protein
MTVVMAKSAQDERTITVPRKDLPLSCPPSSAAVWNLHPRVYLSIEQRGDALCPYCGTHYILEG